MTLNEKALDEKHYQIIPLTKGQFAKVDVDDYEKISEFSWQASLNRMGDKYYAVCGKGKGGLSMRMHPSWTSYGRR